MQGKSIDTVLFDAGNTLMHLDYAFIARVLTKRGHCVNASDIRVAEYAAKAAVDRYFGTPEQGTSKPEAFLWPQASDAERPSYFGIILNQIGVRESIGTDVLEDLRLANEEDCLWRIIEEDTAAVLTNLRARGFSLAVVSNADGRVEGDLLRRGLGGHFRTVVDSSLVGVEKPDPRIFHLALERLETEAQRAVFVGDVFALDVLGARRAGLDAVLLDPLGRYPNDPDCPRITALSELLELLPLRAAS
jgi:putative hydrolase of the HAD superfamily